MKWITSSKINWVNNIYFFFIIFFSSSSSKKDEATTKRQKQFFYAEKYLKIFNDVFRKKDSGGGKWMWTVLSIDQKVSFHTHSHHHLHYHFRFILDSFRCWIMESDWQSHNSFGIELVDPEKNKSSTYIAKLENLLD